MFATLCLDRNERVTFWCGACVGFRIALMENVRTYISEGQLGAVEGRGPVAEERVEISEDAAFEDKTKTAERLADQSPLARGIRQAFMYYGVSIVQTFVEFGVVCLGLSSRCRTGGRERASPSRVPARSISL